MATMLLCWMFLFWMQTYSIFTQNTEIGPFVGLSTKELELLASESDPKCFTRTDSDFTCFWEAIAGQSYNFFYKIGRDDHRCTLTQQTTDNSATVHVCFFNSSNVFLFIPIEISVLDVHTNETVFQREVYVDEKRLLYPMKNISIERMVEPGQLQVRWKAKSGEQFEILYFSQTQPERKEAVKPSNSDHYAVTALAQGEVCSVQMRVKPRGRSFWSDWSKPTVVMVPQKAEATDLLCYTSDLQSIRCQWDKRFKINKSAHNNKFVILYRTKMGIEWGDWKNCTTSNDSSQGCSFDGEQSGDNQVILRDGFGPLDRIFYTEAFKMNNSIKTEPLTMLRGEADGERLRLLWDPPSEVFAQHLIYEMRYRSKDHIAWKHFIWQSSETRTHLNEQAGSQYFIQIKAKPNGLLYDGYWSDWSNVLIVDLPSNNGLLFFACIPLAILLLSAVVISVFSRYFRKVKHYLWPPVPKLDKMLENFLTEGPHWDPTFNIKQCDETPASVVEILSDNHASTDSIPATSAPDAGFYSRVPQKEAGSVVGEGCLEAGCDYVTLTTEVIPCLRGNEYVYDDISMLCSTEMQCHCMNTPTRASTISGLPATSILNQSYQLLPKGADSWGCDSDTDSRYTNLDAAVTGTA